MYNSDHGSYAFPLQMYRRLKIPENWVVQNLWLLDLDSRTKEGLGGVFLFYSIGY